MKKRINKKHVFISLMIIIMLFVVLFLNAKRKPETKLEEEITIYRIGLIENQASEYLALLEAYEAYRTNHGLESLDFEVLYYPNGRTLIEAINEGKLEIGFVDAYSIAKQELASEVEVLGTKNSYESQNYYRSQLLRRIYASYDELQNRNFDYQNATYCLLEPTSIAGYLGVMPFFEEKGLNFVDLNSIQINDYGEGIEKLASGECSVSVGYSNIKSDYKDIWEELEGSEGTIEEEVQIVYTSEKLYENGVLYRLSIPSEVKESLLALLERNAYDEVRKQDFEYLRNIIKKYLGG